MSVPRPRVILERLADQGGGAHASRLRTVALTRAASPSGDLRVIVDNWTPVAQLNGRKAEKGAAGA